MHACVAQATSQILLLYRPSGGTSTTQGVEGLQVAGTWLGSPDTNNVVPPMPSNSSGCSVPASSVTLNSTSLQAHCQSLS